MKRTFFILLLIIILAAALRFFRLDRVPSGLIPEEASTAWNAFSIAHTGRDEWNNFLPIVFRETGGFKLALNSYLMVPVVSLLGLNEFSARFPTAVAGVLAVALTYFLVVEIFKRHDIALSSSFLLAISPWHISMSRYGVDVNWGIPLFLAGLIFFQKSQKKPPLLLVSGIFFTLTYYTYFNYVVFSFIFVLILLYLRRNFLKIKSGVYILLFFFLTQIIFLLPYITAQNLTVRFSQATSVGNIGVINKINEHRQACNAYYPSAFCKIIYNKPVEKITELSKNFINHYSTTTFFLYGSQLGVSGMPQNWGFLYLFEFPLIIIGLALIVKRKIVPNILIFWGFLYAVPGSLASEAHIWRMMTILPLPQIVGAFGLIYIFNFLKNKLLSLLTIFIICFSTLRFMVDYFSYLPFAQGSYSYYGFRDLYKYLSTIEKNYDNIIIAPIGMNFNQLYIYYLFYSQYDPGKYQRGDKLDRVVGEQNWVWVNRIGKWYFVSEPKKVKYPLNKKTLLVIDTSRDDDIMYDKSLTPVLLHTIYHANGDAAFKIFNLR